MTENYADFKFQQPDNIKKISDGLFNALTSNDLSIKIKGLICAPEYFSIKEIKPNLDPHISQILQIYISVMNEIEIEEVLEALEKIIKIFDNKCKDFAIDLTKILVERFTYLNQQEEMEENLNTNKTFMVLDGITKTIIRLFSIFSQHKDIFSVMFENAKKVIDFGFEDENFESLESSLEILSSIMSQDSEVFYPQIWEYYSKAIESVIGTEKEILEHKKDFPDSLYIGVGYESLDKVLSVLLLFITKDNNTFVNGNNGNRLFYISHSINFVQKVVEYAISNREKHNTKYAFKLLSGILETSRGKINDLIPDFLNFGITYIEAKKNGSYAEALTELCASFLLYNAELVINSLNNSNKLQVFLNYWNENMEKQELFILINKNIMALVSILCINPASQNPMIKESMVFIVQKLLALVKKSKKRTKKDLKDFDLDDEEEEIEDEDEKDDKFAKVNLSINYFK